jgi:hypothetical protein
VIPSKLHNVHSVYWVYGNSFEPDFHGKSQDPRICEQCGATTVYYGKSVLKCYEAVVKGLAGSNKQEVEVNIPF